MSRKRSRPRQFTHGGALSAAKLEQVQRMMDEEQWDEARDVVAQHLHFHPNDTEALQTMADIYQNAQNGPGLWQVCVDRLLKLVPNLPETWNNAVVACVVNELTFSAHYHADKFLERWPDHPEAGNMRQLHAKLEDACQEILAHPTTEQGVTAEDLRQFEEAKMLMNVGELARARQLSRQIIKRLPSAVAPLNNMCLGHMLSGQLDEAMRYGQEALERRPDNIHALANMIQLLARLGRDEEARQLVSRLCANPPANEDFWGKQLEALTFMRDDRAVIEWFEAHQQAFKQRGSNMPYHLAAVAYAREGDERRARKLWEQILKSDPHFILARENLDDLRKPLGQRSGAWPYDLRYWTAKSWLEEIIRAIEKVGDDRPEVGERRIGRLLSQTPGLAAAIPILLERGDPAGRQFALIVATKGRLPILRDFALSTNGTDAERMQAAQAAAEAGLLPRGESIRFYGKGEQQEVELMEFEIHSESEPSDLPDEVQDMLERTHDLIGEGKYKEGERLAREALKLAPDYPTLLNYLATILFYTKRKAEAEEVVRHTLERHPDYLFARCNMAQIYAGRGQIEEAQEMLKPLMQRKRFHISEYRALSLAQFENALASGELEAAETLLDILEQMEMDKQALGQLKTRLGMARLARRRKA